MYVAICINSLAVGGAEKAAINLASALNQHGHNAKLIVLHQHGQYKLPNDLPVSFIVQGKRLKFPLFRRRRMAAKLTKKLNILQKENQQFDLILSNLHHCNQVLRLTKFNQIWYILHSPPSIELQHASQPQKHLREKVKIYDNQKLITVSQSIADDVSQCPHIAPNQLKVIHNVFDKTLIETLAQENNSSIPDSPFILFIARFSREKQFELAFEAYKKIAHSIKLVVLTNDQQAVLNLAKAYGLSDNIICPGFQQNPYPWIKQAKLLFNCSAYEGFPNTFIEALLLNTPIVSFAFNHKIPEAMLDGLEDWVVFNQTAAGLAEKLAQAIQHQFPMQQAKIQSKVAREYVIKQLETLLTIN